MIRRISPKIVMNNRLDLPTAQADIHTPEQIQPTEWVKVDGEPVVWEACQTFSGSWGYHRDEETWKSPEQLIMMLINTVSCGGNLLMNVGPTSLGTFDPRATRALEVYRDWMEFHGRSDIWLHPKRIHSPRRLPPDPERAQTVRSCLCLAFPPPAPAWSAAARSNMRGSSMTAARCS